MTMADDATLEAGGGEVAPEESGLPALPPPPPPPPERKRGKAVPIAIGAAILAVIVAVVAIVVGGSERTKNATAPSTAASVAPPYSFTAIATSFSVTLNWAAPPGAAVTSYTVLRNGTFVTTVNAPATTFTDVGVTPGQSYTYEIKAQVGSRVSTTVSTITETPTPELADARLDGQYTVKTKYLSQTGYISTPKPRTLEWVFTPLCSSGPCDVSWIDLFYSGIRTTLRRAGTTYTGADHGYFGGTCASKKTIQGLRVTIRVVAAKAFGGEWVPSRFIGAIIENDAPQFGCVGPTGTISVTGTLNG
jgi:hypothetical protein